MSGGTFQNKLLAVATRQVGIRESGGENSGVPFERYSLKGEQPLPWCARFVRWCVGEAGGLVPGNLYEVAAVEAFQVAMGKHVWLLDSTVEPEPGDIIFFKTREGSDHGTGRHMGIVSAVTDKTVKTIEGNSGDRVAQREYMRWSNRIACYGRFPSDGGVHYV